MRHAAAKNVNIKIETNKSNISLKIQDDGKGIIKSDISANNNTFGVFGMKERASMLGGMMEIDSKQNNGTTINVNLPLTSKRT